MHIPVHKLHNMYGAGSIPNDRVVICIMYVTWNKETKWVCQENRFSVFGRYQWLNLQPQNSIR